MTIVKFVNTRKLNSIMKISFSFTVLAHVHYDDNNWSLIQTTLLNDHLSIDLPSRVRLVTDIFALAEAGILLYDFLFKTMQYLSKENSYSPWAVASTNFYKIRERLFGTSLFIPYQVSRYNFKNK